MRHLAILTLLAPTYLLANTFDAPQVPIETRDLITRPAPISATESPDVQAALPTSAPVKNITLNEQDLLRNRPLLEELIGQAIKTKDAAFLQDLLSLYQKHPERDLILQDYAQSALLYLHGKLSQAIDLQQNLVEQHPDLPYMRMNLATMQLEDKRFADAEQQFEHLAQQTEQPALRAIANAHLKSLAHMQQWQFDGQLEYDRNNNVNNASAEREIVINGARLQKSEQSLPKSAEGLRYGVSVSRFVPLAGNHALSFSGSVNGRHYWDNHEYSQHNVYISGSYIYQNKNWTFRTTPFALQSWLGGARYTQSWGASQSAAYQFLPAWRVQLSVSGRKMRYHDADLRDFDSRYVSLTPVLVYSRPTFGVHFGVTVGKNQARKESLSSKSWQVFGGVSKQFNYFGASASLSYGKERYNQAPKLRVTPYPFRRDDKIIQTDVAIWNPKWHYWGLMPKLNFSRYQIVSNMPAFYSRKSQRVYLSVEKRF
ncbi:surface lipoprotein assembly modifier [Kingella kingae]|uniref:surface lipoprotein assembly modifier n=1 Tax=Kingella kingae TaxID=504 RepID=UPI00041A8C76|nr:surface lipoprotein assembly modifier [Kingella kingae]MDK4533500.1 surface lipoprotein assembly modifier [Kingella kingae]MDK4540018.1 surface lipoprotein assembly modifier [Kingella kingae]MDK4552533.1 surface lipoprotein assembly modifier [Kingella kingae]